MRSLQWPPASALTSLPDQTLAAAIAVATGFFAASWNGIYTAEIARLSAAANQTAEVTSGSVVTFLGYVSGPSIFPALVRWTDGYRVPFISVAP